MLKTLDFLDILTGACFPYRKVRQPHLYRVCRFSFQPGNPGDSTGLQWQMTGCLGSCLFLTFHLTRPSYCKWITYIHVNRLWLMVFYLTDVCDRDCDVSSITSLCCVLINPRCCPWCWSHGRISSYDFSSQSRDYSDVQRTDYLLAFSKISSGWKVYKDTKDLQSHEGHFLLMLLACWLFIVITLTGTSIILHDVFSFLHLRATVLTSLLLPTNSDREPQKMRPGDPCGLRWVPECSITFRQATPPPPCHTLPTPSASATTIQSSSAQTHVFIMVSSAETLNHCNINSSLFGFRGVSVASGLFILFFLN